MPTVPAISWLTPRSPVGHWAAGRAACPRPWQPGPITVPPWGPPQVCAGWAAVLDKDRTGATPSSVAATSPTGHSALARRLVRYALREAQACQSLMIWKENRVQILILVY